MATQLKIRRGTTAEHASFTGAEGEITLDTTKDTLVAHDNYTAGGRPMLREDLNNLANGTIAITKIVPGTARYYLRTNAAGTAVEYDNAYEVTLLFSRSPTASGHTATLSENLRNFKFLIFQSSEWYNIHQIPTEVFTAGNQHMLHTYDAYHSYVTYSNDTTITCTAGSGNTTYKIWGIQ